MELPPWQRCCVKVSHVWREGRAGCQIMAWAQEYAARSKEGWSPLAVWLDSYLQSAFPLLAARRTTNRFTVCRSEHDREYVDKSFILIYPSWTNCERFILSRQFPSYFQPIAVKKKCSGITEPNHLPFHPSTYILPGLATGYITVHTTIISQTGLWGTSHL